MVNVDQAVRPPVSLSLLLNHGTISKLSKLGDNKLKLWLWQLKPQRRKLSLQALDSILLHFHLPQLELWLPVMLHWFSIT